MIVLGLKELKTKLDIGKCDCSKSLSFIEGQRVILSEIHYEPTNDLKVTNHQMEYVQSTKEITISSF